MGVFGDPASIQKLATELRNVSTDASIVVPYLQGRVQGLVPRSWSGQAADAFTAHWGTESFDMSELGITSGSIATVLAELAIALEQANQLAASAGRVLTGANPRLQQATQMAQQAWTRATMQLAGQTIPQVGPATTPQQAETWAKGIVSLPTSPNPLQQAEQSAQDWLTGAWDDTVNWVEVHQTDLLNLFGDAGWATLGLLGMAATLPVEGGGLLLDASGGGAILGVPLNIAGAGLFAASFTATTVAGGKALIDFQHLFSTSSGPGSSSGQAPLRHLHAPSTLDPSSVGYWSRQSTQDIVRSLDPSSDEPLIVKSDGTIMNGNTRIYELEKRGYDVNSLPRVPYNPSLPPDGFWD